MAARQFWLLKTEPASFSIDDLARAPRQTTCWDGVRNYQARNFMRAMRVGEQALFYHSNADPPAVVGTVTIVREAYPDRTALDPDDHHFDSKATQDNPIWEMVDVRLESIFPRPLGLDELRRVPALADMELLRKGSRLSVQPVAAREFETIVQMAGHRQPSKAATRAKTKRARS